MSLLKNNISNKLNITNTDKNVFTMVYKKNKIIKQKIPKTFNIFCQIDKYQIYEVIDIIFKECCNLDVYGYTKLYDEYWGKKNDTYFKLNVVKYDVNISTISIIPIFYNEKQIKNIYNQILESINIYENTFH
jgi:hypothetical protein